MRRRLGDGWIGITPRRRQRPHGRPERGSFMDMLTLLAAAAACIANVHDGDTMRLCDGERVRIANIDAPEMRGSSRCERSSRRRSSDWCDHKLAEQSRNALRAFLRTGSVSITRLGVDRFGRTLALVRVDGEDAGRHLIARGLARAWR